MKRLKDLETENTRLRRAVSDLTRGKMILAGGGKGKLLSPARRRTCIDHVRGATSRFRAAGLPVLGQHRIHATPVPKRPDDEERLTADIVELARLWPLWLSEDRPNCSEDGGLGRQPQAGRADLAARGAEGTRQTTQTRPALAQRRLLPSAAARSARNHVWSYDFVEDRTHDGKKLSACSTSSTSSLTNAWPFG